MKARVRWKVTSAPRPGAGIGLLGFTVWVVLMCLWACWVVLQGLVIGVIVASVGVAQWVGQHRRSRE